ncbi:GNAT family N-acetyltransferase [Cysteiniphilum litorale]|uniref:GNAT family N-acetyltransferase n=1 Tax=Cysteiniphilum litorale TaxID=2056700 RepID=UPI003F882787
MIQFKEFNSLSDKQKDIIIDFCIEYSDINPEINPAARYLPQSREHKKMAIQMQIYQDDRKFYFLGDDIGFIGYYTTSVMVTICAVYVNESHRKKGYGEQLIRTLIDYIGKEYIFEAGFYHSQTNKDSLISFYEKLGFLNLYKKFGKVIDQSGMYLYGYYDGKLETELHPNGSITCFPADWRSNKTWQRLQQKA